MPVAAAVLDELALDDADADAEVEVEVELELDELLLHPAAASPVQAMASRATAGALVLAKTGIIPRTLPLIVAWRKESGHPGHDKAVAVTHLALSAPSGIVAWVSTPNFPSAPEGDDLKALARDMRRLFELAASTLTDGTGPAELVLRVTGHLGCELQAIVQVAERFPSWEHVNMQRGIDAYFAARENGAEWFGVSGLGHRPREDIRCLLNMPSHAGLR